MQASAHPPLLRRGLLDGLDVVLCRTGDDVSATLGELGADVRMLDADPLDEDALTAAAAALERATVLVCDAGALMRAAQPGAGLRDAVAGAWNATRALVNAQLAPSGFGKVVLIAPRPADGDGAAAAGAALENLARTTAVEWARLGIRVVVVRPRDVTSERR